MPVPLPAPERTNTDRPSEEEVHAMARGVATMTSLTGEPDGLLPLQRLILEALYPAMTGHRVEVDRLTPLAVPEVAAALARRDLGFRSRVVQTALLTALVQRPLPQDVVDRVAAFACELGVDEHMISIARRFASGALGLAALDFERNGYTASWKPEDVAALHTSSELRSAWEQSSTDPALAARWAALEHLPAGSLGRSVWELYRARGFVFPGLPGSAPPLLAQHDWVHVLADYGTTVENEVEVFAFIARSNDDMRAFSLLAMVVSLFETGYLRTGAGLFEYHPGHLSANRDLAVRLADAMYRGACCRDHLTGSDSIDFLRLDWFELAPLPVEEVRQRFGVVPKSAAAVAAGSLGPWEPGGISPFQLAAGRAAAEADGRPYDAYGACSA